MRKGRRDEGMQRAGRIFVGTSGWTYPHWKGHFYPSDVSESDRLPFYARHFSSCEINHSFYRLPANKDLKRWAEETPQDFVFAVKASRYITHMKKLKDPRGPVDNFLERTRELGRKLGPILFQCPPRWKANPGRLGRFLEALPDSRRYAFEFRDESWFDTAVTDRLESYNAAFCIYDLGGRVSPRRVTADFVYIRLHGPGAEKYQGRYDTQALSGWAGAADAWARSGRDVYCYFDNDQRGYAAGDALRLRQMTGDAPSS